jgi:hypothetical protein
VLGGEDGHMKNHPKKSPIIIHNFDVRSSDLQKWSFIEMVMHVPCFSIMHSSPLISS